MKTYTSNKHYNLPVAQFCPTCNHKLDCCTAVEVHDRRPKVGDISMCLRCGEVLEFNEDLTVRVATLQALIRMSPQQQLLVSKAQQHIRRNRWIK